MPQTEFYSSIPGPEIHATVRLHHLKAPRERHKGFFPGSGAKKIWKKGRLNGNAIISIFSVRPFQTRFPGEKFLALCNPVEKRRETII
nr:hypothetical protein [Bacillaceae bacterium]